MTEGETPQEELDRLRAENRELRTHLRLLEKQYEQLHFQLERFQARVAKFERLAPAPAPAPAAPAAAAGVRTRRRAG